METTEILDSTPAVAFILLQTLDEKGKARHTLSDLARGRATRPSVDLLASLRDYELPAQMSHSVVQLARPTVEAVAEAYLHNASSNADSDVVAKAATSAAAILVSGGAEADPRKVDRDELDAALRRLADGG